ncbi:MAG: potassium-transporting ATPase subunit KdpC [Nitrospirae bacterium]|nr:potassium-transporting ATPase subunit KdpC [Nitrospirota bacterium]
MTTMIRNAFMSLLLFTILTGVIYPLTVTVVAQALFPHQANGSIFMKDGRPIGSTLLGRQFDDPKYFWGRLSATRPYPYNGGASSGSNRGPNHPDLVKSVQARIDALRASDQANTRPIPVDLVTASASGLDPHISPAAAEYQAARVARNRGMDEAKVRAVIAAYTGQRQFGILGEPVVNVLQLNLAMDELK